MQQREDIYPLAYNRAVLMVVWTDHIRFSFEGADEMDDVRGQGELCIEEGQSHFVLNYHQGDTFTFIYARPT
jgi:hypothetical protein